MWKHSRFLFAIMVTLVLTPSAGQAFTPEATRILKEMKSAVEAPLPCPGTADQIRPAIQAAVARIKAREPKYFGTPPKQFIQEVIKSYGAGDCR